MGKIIAVCTTVENSGTISYKSNGILRGIGDTKVASKDTGMSVGVGGTSSHSDET